MRRTKSVGAISENRFPEFPWYQANRRSRHRRAQFKWEFEHDENKKCPICLNFLRMRDIHCFYCGHGFCKRCYKAWENNCIEESGFQEDFKAITDHIAYLKALLDGLEEVPEEIKERDEARTLYLEELAEYRNGKMEILGQLVTCPICRQDKDSGSKSLEDQMKKNQVKKAMEFVVSTVETNAWLEGTEKVFKDLKL